MMIPSPSTLRALTAQDASRWHQLVAEAFPAVQGAHYLEDFPIWDPAQSVAPRQMIGYFGDANQLLGGAGARLVEMQVPGRGARIKGAVVGAVATVSSARKQGVATRCLEHLLAWCDSQGAEFVALWGSDHKFYKKFGFELLGQQSRAPLLGWNAPLSPGAQIKRGWDSEIGQAVVASRSRSGLHLEAADLSWISRHTHVDWWSLWRSGELVAYAGVGKGMDLHHFVHEWGAVRARPDDAVALKSLLSRIAEADGDAQILAHPRDFKGLLSGAPLQEGLALLRLRTETARKWVDQFWFWGLDSA